MTAFTPDYIEKVLPLLWDGMQVTLLLTALSLVGGGVLGTVLAVLRLSRRKPPGR